MATVVWYPACRSPENALLSKDRPHVEEAPRRPPARHTRRRGTHPARLRHALARGRGRRIGMLATFAPSVLTMTEEFEQFVGEAGAKATLETIVVEGAMDALRKGDADRHNALIAARAP